MSNKKIVNFPGAMPLSDYEGITAEEAFHASIELIRLQQIFPMLRTPEEKANNLAESQQMLDVMTKFITQSYFKKPRTVPMH